MKRRGKSKKIEVDVRRVFDNVLFSSNCVDVDRELLDLLWQRLHRKHMDGLYSVKSFHFDVKWFRALHSEWPSDGEANETTR